MQLRSKRGALTPESSPTKRTKRNVLRDNTQVVNLPLSPPVTPTKQRVIDVKFEVKNLDYCDATGVKKLDFGNVRVDRLKNVYSRAKALFQRGCNQLSTTEPAESLTGRDREGSQLNQFLTNNISNNVCNSLYISGPPGTGKSAQCDVSFNYITNKISTKTNHDEYLINGNKFRIIKINCMTISKPEYIFHEIFCCITKTSSLTFSRKKTFDDVYNLFLHSSLNLDSVILLLDEMDCLITKDQQVLFQLFNCASQFKSKILTTKLILIGISNALDLTDKFLPRLKSNGLNPQSLQFLPYTSDKIKSIIVDKLRSLTDQTGSIPIMNPIAIQLCCKKSASVTGDLRKAFDICYKSIELVEANTKKDGNLSSLTFENAPKVHITHVASIFSNAFGIDTLTKLKNLNLLQKLVLCTLFKFQNDPFALSNRKKLTVNYFYDYYIRFINEKIDNLLGKLKKGEFLEIISALESSSVITLNSDYGIDIGNQIVKSNIPYDDLMKSVGDIGVLKTVLTLPTNL